MKYTKTSKYGLTITETKDMGFLARVVRRRTSRGTTVEREQGNFPDRNTAVAWGEAQLAEYLTDLEARKVRRKQSRAENRAKRKERDAWLESQTLQSLGTFSGSHRDAAETLKWKSEALWQEIALRALKRGETEADAIDLANQTVGKNWSQRLAKALNGDLDHVSEAVTDMARANALRLFLAASDDCA